MSHLATDPGARTWTLDGSVVFVDISGFTTLSERLARKGKEGAELVTEAIEACFTELLSVAYANGGGLLKFGGDALLLFFDGDDHQVRAAAAAVGMRTALRSVGKITVPGAKVQLRMSVGAHSGSFHFFLVGESHRELLVTGPAWTSTVQMEHEAVAGQIRVSQAMASHLPERSLGPTEGPGALLLREPGPVEERPIGSPPSLPGEAIAGCLSALIRRHVAAGGGAPEHRPVVTAFLRFGGTDAVIEGQGPESMADALHALVSGVQHAADEQGVCFLGSDVDANGGKLILTSGAPVNTGSDDERMLLALRRIADTDFAVPFGIGVHRGAVFAGDIGPWYRRTYTVMGDDVNLAARLMAHAGSREIYATSAVIEHSGTRFEVTEIEPFAVKGKKELVTAWSLGSAVGSRSRDETTERSVLLGRDEEMRALSNALDAVTAGDGRLVEVVGEPGIGKTRLLEEIRAGSEGLISLRATCEAYTASTPYIAWRELLRELLDLRWEEPDDVVLERLYSIVSASDPDLLDWLPLIALPFDVEIPATLEVEMLGEEFVQPKLHEVFTRFLQLVLPEPALIEIEDAHHMDDASADLLRYLADHLDGEPWLFCVTRRPETRGFVAPGTAWTVVIEPGPLRADDALRLAEVAAERRPLPPHVLATVADRSGGNPQFVQDLVLVAAERGGAESLPDSMESAAMARIDSLSPQDRQLVRRASVLGLTLDPTSLAWVLDEGTPLPDAQTWDRLGEFFEPEGEGYFRFRRALVRDAAYEGLPFRSRRSLHAVVGERLEAVASGGEDHTAALSIHMFLAGSYDKAWRYGRLAGDMARDKSVPSEAARFYRRALDAARRSGSGVVPSVEIAEVTEGLGEALVRAGELGAAPDAFAAARRLRNDDPPGRARLLLREAYIAERVGRSDLVVRRARRALSELKDVESQAAAELRANATVSMAAARQIQGRAAEAVRLSSEAVEQAEAAGDRKALADAFVVMDWSLLELGRMEEATHLQRAIEIYEDLGDVHSGASAYNALGAVAYFQGRWHDAIELYERMVEAKQRLGDPVHAANGTLNVAEVLSDQGLWEEAEDRLRTVLRVARGAREELLVAYATAYVGRVVGRAGRPREAEALLSEARAFFVSQGADREVEQVGSWLAEAALFDGRWQEALDSAGSLMAAEGASAALLQRVRGVGLAALGDESGARTAMQESLRLADDEGSAFERACTMTALAELWPDDPEAAAAREDAEALFASLGVIRIARPPRGVVEEGVVTPS